MFLKIVVFSFCFLVVRSASVKQLEFSSSSQIQNEQNVNPELLGEKKKIRFFFRRKTFSFPFLGGGVEGDMIFPPQSATTRGVAIRGLFRRWPDAVIPFDFSRITSKTRFVFVSSIDFHFLRFARTRTNSKSNDSSDVRRWNTDSRSNSTSSLCLFSTGCFN